MIKLKKLIKEDLLKKLIEELGLTILTCHSLKRAGINTVKDLISIRNIGKKSI